MPSTASVALTAAQGSDLTKSGLPSVYNVQVDFRETIAKGLLHFLEYALIAKVLRIGWGRPLAIVWELVLGVSIREIGGFSEV